MASVRRVKRSPASAESLLAAMLLLFLVPDAWHIPYLADPAPVRGMTGTVAALTGVTLLVIDIVLPVPSSVVMITHGALFGVALGTGLSLLGSLGSFSVGFALGRRGTALVVRAWPKRTGGG